MAQLMEHIEYLSKEIGPRPAGTEEEQQASLYITEQFQTETGFTANIEEFEGSTNQELIQAALALVIVLVTVLAIFFDVLAIPAFILAAIAAAVYTMEAFDRPVISRFLSHAASQNVVAKYQPSTSEAQKGRARSRKIVLIAHYDTGRVTPSIVQKAESSSLPLGLICVVGAIAAAFFLLIRIFIAAGGGMGLLVLNVLSIVAALICLLPVVKTALTRTAPYNEGAVNNASGTAALIEVARRIARGSVSEAELAQYAEQEGDVVIHGEDAAREEGLVPEGASLTYETTATVAYEQPDEEGDYNEEERLLAAKAAIAALTGKPVESRVYSDIAEKHELDGTDGQVEPQGEGFESDGSSASTGELEAIDPSASFQGESAGAEGFSNAPSWFVAAQQNARKSDNYDTGAINVQRSKYTEAFDYAERERAEKEAQRRLAEQAEREAAQRAREEELRLSLERAEEERRYLEVQRRQEFAAQQDEVPFEGQEVPAYGFEEPVEGELVDTVAPDTTAPSAAVPAEEARYYEEAPSLVDIPAVYDGSVPPQDDDVPNRQGMMAGLPAIDMGGVPETTSPSRSGLFRTLRANVPSLSGIMKPVDVDTPASRNPAVDLPSITEADARAEAEAELIAVPSTADVPEIISGIPPIVSVPAMPVSQEETQASVVAPTDDAASDSLANSTIAMDPIDYSLEYPLDVEPPVEQPAQAARDAAPVAVPRSRSGSLLDRLRRNRGEESLSDTPQEWLDVDEDFEARSVGRARGSWESFRDDQYFDDDEQIDEFGSGDEQPRGRRWQGGAYSRESLGRVNMRSGAESEADEPISEEPELTQDEKSLTGEIERIYHFRNPQFNMEIWFVAVGCDGFGHDGARAFIEEHRDELRGSIFIEVESLGAGALSVATEEGRVNKVTSSSRIKRFAREATAATGIALDSVSLAGTDSISSTVQKSGFQAMHLFGAENGRPALKGSADDVMENIDELLLDEHINYVYELLKR